MRSLLIVNDYFQGKNNAVFGVFLQRLLREMITKKTSTKSKKYYYFILLPLLVSLFFSFSNSSLHNENVPGIFPVNKKDFIRISSGYGMRIHPITGEYKMHKGIDIAAKTGTPVLATADGTVVLKKFEEEGKGYGRYIVIKHDETYSTLYSQLSGFNVEKGQKVKQGDIIGYVGKSGYSTGTHLHYEVWVHDKKVNPAEYFD